MKDEVVTQLIERERAIYLSSLDLIASENYTSVAVRNALSSTFSNKYAEGEPGKRLYPGMNACDELEQLCVARLRALFKVPADYNVTVQPLSGGPANLALISAVVPTNGRVLMMDERDGGHFTHGGEGHLLRRLYTYDFYRADSQTGLFSLENLRQKVQQFKPDLVIIGASEIVEDYDYRAIRAVVGNAHLHADISHIAGLIAGGQLASPFPIVDSVASTTHKTLRGPRGGILISRKNVFPALFPGFQAGPHMATIAALSIALFEAAQPSFVDYARQVVCNARVLAAIFLQRGYRLVGAKTDTHMVIVQVGDGASAEVMLGKRGILVNGCHFCGDDGGKTAIRVGTPMLTTLGLKEHDFEYIATLIVDVLEHKDVDADSVVAAICTRYKPDDLDLAY